MNPRTVTGRIDQAPPQHSVNGNPRFRITCRCPSRPLRSTGRAVMSASPITRFRVGADHTARMWFVRDTLTGRCRSGYRSPTEAFAVARRANRALTIAQREACA